jgi:integrase
MRDMKLEPHDDSAGMKVWLTRDEVNELLDATDDTEQRIALALMARSGLRRAEVTDVLPGDVVETSAGPRVRVRDGKGSKYRETPVPADVYSTIQTLADVRPEGADVPLVDRSTRTLGRWVQRAAQRRHDVTDDDGWTHLSCHDLRRTWGTLLLSEEVLPHVVMDWGGWESFEVFREHYLGAASPEVERQELDKVEWL